MSNTPAKRNIMDAFIDGAKKGWNIAISSIIPNVVMAYIIIKFLNVSTLLSKIEVLFEPIMRIFGLPGSAVTVLAAAFMSMGGATGAAATLYADGKLDAFDLAIMLPAIYLMGSLVQYMGRILGTAAVKSRYFAVMLAICVLNATISLFIMRIVVAFYRP